MMSPLLTNKAAEDVTDPSMQPTSKWLSLRQWQEETTWVHHFPTPAYLLLLPAWHLTFFLSLLK